MSPIKGLLKMTDERKSEILEFVKINRECSSKEIHDGITSSISYATVKRLLTKLTADKLFIIKGKGKGTKYSISAF